MRFMPVNVDAGGQHWLRRHLESLDRLQVHVDCNNVVISVALVLSFLFLSFFLFFFCNVFYTLKGIETTTVLVLGRARYQTPGDNPPRNLRRVPNSRPEAWLSKTVKLMNEFPHENIIYGSKHYFTEKDGIGWGRDCRANSVSVKLISVPVSLWPQNRS